MEDLKNKGRRLNWRQACKLLGCGKSKFYELIKCGILTSYKIKYAKRGIWVYEKDCICLIEKQKK